MPFCKAKHSAHTSDARSNRTDFALSVTAIRVGQSVELQSVLAIVPGGKHRVPAQQGKTEEGWIGRLLEICEEAPETHLLVGRTSTWRLSSEQGHCLKEEREHAASSATRNDDERFELTIWVDICIWKTW